jgi:CheY-like chemotaxis protein
MEDEEPVRMVIKAMLEQFGFCVDCVEDGAEAVEVYRQRREEGSPYYAVILDLTVPGGIGGKEAIAMLLELDPDVKAIVSSGYCNDPVMANYWKYGFKSVLSKPYRPQDLNQALQAVAG